MGIREKINNSKFAPIIGGGFLVVAAAIAVFYFWPRGPHINYRLTYYSDDDGQTYFKDSIYKFAPFDHNGKTAVGAVVYEDAHNDVFVGYLTRFTPETQRQLEKIYSDASSTGSAAQVQQAVLDVIQSPRVAWGGTEIKLPGPQNHWMPRGQMMNPPIKLPDGGITGQMLLP
jgi:hypothetical protein